VFELTQCTMELVTVIILAVSGTTLPLVFDMLRTFVPQRLRYGRLVAAWHRQVLLCLVCGLCGAAYLLFWRSMLPYSYAPASLAGALHGLLATWLWLMTVYNFAMCCAVDAGTVAQPSEPEVEAGGGSGKGHWPAGSHHCHVCRVRVLQFDHHCPFTGGCVGQRNFRFFLLFALHGWAGMSYACALSWPPFRDCVWRQLDVPSLGWARMPPPEEGACIDLASRSLLLLPSAALCGALSQLALLHLLLLANGVSTVRLAQRWRTRGFAYLRDLALLRAQREVEVEVDKWTLLFGTADGNAPTKGRLARRVRVLLLPSLPEAPWQLHAGLASRRLWAGALLCIVAAAAVVLLGAQLLGTLVRVDRAVPSGVNHGVGAPVREMSHNG